MHYSIIDFMHNLAVTVVVSEIFYTQADLCIIILCIMRMSTVFDLCQEKYVEECLCCSYVGHVVYNYINEAPCLLLKFKLNILVLFSLPREKNVGEKEFVSVLKGSFYRTAFMSILPNSL